MKNKRLFSMLTVLLCVVLCMTSFATVAYADGGDYYDDELPPETWQEEITPEPTPEATEPPAAITGTPFTEDGIASTRDLLYDKETNKQFIVVETRNGHTLYIVIDYDNLLDGEEERYQTYFLNPVDEADLLALLEDENGSTPIVCSCTEKCVAGEVNTSCALCKNDMTNCTGKEATPTEPEKPDEPTTEKSSAGAMIALVLLLAAGGGVALWYFKLRKPKSDVKGGDGLDEFDFDDEDEETYDYGDDGNAPEHSDEQEDEE